MQRSFTVLTDHMSLWEVAHRWAGVHPEETDEKKLPLQVSDILKQLLFAQSRSEIRTSKPNGFIVKDWTYIPSWKNYIPFDDQGWDGTDDHLRELYIERMNKIVEPHEKLTANHHAMAMGSIPFSKDYLEGVHLDAHSLADWSLEHDLPFPDFWFSPDEKQEVINDHERKKRIDSKFDMEQEDSDSSEVDEQQEELNQALFKPGKVKAEHIDQFWNRLTNSQQSRLICRAIAREMWNENNERTVQSIIDDEVIQKYAGGKRYSGKDTIRDWIKDLDPRPEDERLGRPKKQ